MHWWYKANYYIRVWYFLVSSVGLVKGVPKFTRLEIGLLHSIHSMMRLSASASASQQPRLARARPFSRRIRIGTEIDTQPNLLHELPCHWFSPQRSRLHEKRQGKKLKILHFLERPYRFFFRSFLVHYCNLIFYWISIDFASTFFESHWGNIIQIFRKNLKSSRTNHILYRLVMK